ncbi:MAG: hypothetical protein HYZ14_05400 [Bacteroidetes bacterium]|nr:hypothetical protein [Bacteroidota bacterium]
MELFIALGSTAAIMLALIKLELIKSVVNKVGAAKYSLPIHILVLAIVTASSLYLSSFFPGEEEAATTETSSEKSEFAQNVEAGTELYHTVDDEVGEFMDNKHNRDSIYEANRDRQWVYQIGDIVSDENLLFDTYLSLGTIEDVGVFKIDNDNYFLFKDYHRSEEMMNDSLNSFKRALNTPGLKCRVVDIIANCNKRQQVVRTNDLKIKQGKEKLFLPCYECGK